MKNDMLWYVYDSFEIYNSYFICWKILKNCYLIWMKRQYTNMDINDYNHWDNQRSQPES